MSELFITPGPIAPTLTAPPSKSHTLRALFFGMLGRGKSVIHSPLHSKDTETMLRAITLFGARAQENEGSIEVEGGFHPPLDVIDAGNSGIVYRFLAAAGALLPAYTVVTGDLSVRTCRPIVPLLGALQQLGAFAQTARGDGQAPILVRGLVKPGICRLDGSDSQPVSALLSTLCFLDGRSEVIVNHPKEQGWIDLTLSWLKRLGAKLEHHNYCHYSVEGGLSYEGFSFRVPGDFSSVLFPIAAALVTHSPLLITGLDPLDVQPDKIVLEILRQMGAHIEWQREGLFVHPGAELRGIEIDINLAIDALPILATLACFASGKTTLYNGAIARRKESDRISAIAEELKKMGAQIEEKSDGLVVSQSALQGANLDSHHDHRIAMSLVVAALGAKGSSTLSHAECIDKSYPQFIHELGVDIELDLIRI